MEFRKQEHSANLVIDNIPSEYCNEEAIKTHFSKFGNLESIELVDNFAMIKFSTIEEATQCISSPDDIFNDKSVKCYWQPKELTERLARESEERLFEEMLAKKKALLLIHKKRNEILAKQVLKRELVVKELEREDLSQEDRNELGLELEKLNKSIETKRQQLERAVNTKPEIVRDEGGSE